MERSGEIRNRIIRIIGRRRRRGTKALRCRRPADGLLAGGMGRPGEGERNRVLLGLKKRLV
jgi:hypothetical protein